MRKPKELYQEGFLCLFDTRGEMFFRSKTYIHHHKTRWQFETAHSLQHIEQELTLHPERGGKYDLDSTETYDHPDDDLDEPLVWHPTWMDAAFLHDGNEEIDEFCFIGHFEISGESKKMRYSFGRGYMSDVDGTIATYFSAEDWEYRHYDTQLFGTINMDKLRVIVD